MRASASNLGIYGSEPVCGPESRGVLALRSSTRTKPAVNAQGRVRESRCIRYRPISRIDDAIATTRGIVMTVASFR